MDENVTNHVTSRQSLNVTFHVIPPCNTLCFNNGMKNAMRAVRKKLGLDQEQFGEIIKKSRVHVSRMENAVTPPSFKQLEDIVKSINHYYGKQQVILKDFYEIEGESEGVVATNEQEKALLGLMRQMTEKDQDKFINMAEAFVGSDAGLSKGKIK